MVQFGLLDSLLAFVGGLAGGAFSPWFSARIDRSRKRRELFKPIYNNISSVAEHGLQKSNAQTWNSMSASDQLLVSPKLEEKLNEYSEKTSKYKEKRRQLFAARGEFDSALPDDVYDPPGASNNTGKLQPEGAEHEMRVVNISLPSLIRRLELYDCDISDDVRSKIVEDAERHEKVAHLNSIQHLNREYPSWTSDIHRVLQSDSGHEWIAAIREVESYAEEIEPVLRKSILSTTDRLKRMIP
jgi:hypothetical protein